MKSKVPRNFRYLINKNRETDTLNFWFRGDKLDSLKFAIKEQDTTRLFNVKFKKELRDSLEISVITKSIMGLLDSFKIKSNLPLVKINLDLINIKGLDSLSVPYKASLDKNYDRLPNKDNVDGNSNLKMNSNIETEITLAKTNFFMLNSLYFLK